MSLFFSAQAIYNLVVYDNCNGPNADPESCILTNQPEPNIVPCGDPLCDIGECEKCGDDCNCTECVNGTI